ncbi:MAG: hypothetical protein AVDCRST_MAG73-3806 [uncultured Thermomicrobiales bacterium]|uniref:Uncharacterized protein n=1 Tax=uncultured Thermomicrobiales bacterium TaxID=1645740 RepID=A0A6J4UWT4_9BACT|nr:MAG: hypothetical protein AVDCRST_MAG73-3806 [uncultured Thermomicrobiales bacterium]
MNLIDDDPPDVLPRQLFSIEGLALGMETGINRALEDRGLTPTAITLGRGAMTILVDPAGDSESVGDERRPVPGTPVIQSRPTAPDRRPGGRASDHSVAQSPEGGRQCLTGERGGLPYRVPWIRIGAGRPRR